MTIRMWTDLREAGCQVHNGKSHFSPSNNSCTHWLTIQASIDVESCLSYFNCGLFLNLVRCPWVLGSPSNGSISLNKQTVSCKSPQVLLMSLAMDLVLFCVVCGGKNGTNGCHLAGFSEFCWSENIINGCHLASFSEDVALAHHFVATRLPPPSYPIGFLLALTMPEKYVKWWEIQPAIHSIVGG